MVAEAVRRPAASCWSSPVAPGLSPPAEDRKLQGVVREIRAFLKGGFHPVVFCRFVDTAYYVARHLRDALPDSDPGGIGHRPTSSCRTRVGIQNPSHTIGAVRIPGGENRDTVNA